MTRPAAALLAVTLAAAAAAPARADDRRKAAAEHFSLAESAEKRQDWRAAIDEYQQAYAIQPHPSVLYNIARNYERLEEWQSAAVYYRRYLDDSPDAKDRDKVEATIARLEAAAAAARPERAGQGWLVVLTSIDGAEVSVDGQAAGTTPLELQTSAGLHEIAITRAGYAPAQREVAIPAGGTEQVREVLEPLGPPAATSGLVLGIGFASGIASESTYEGAFWVGWHGPRLEASLLALLGKPSVVGVDARLYLTSRPTGATYLRAAAGYGKESSTTSGLLADAGLGFLWMPALDAPITLHIGYTIDAGARVYVRTDKPAMSSLQTTVIGFQLTGGVVFRY